MMMARWIVSGLLFLLAAALTAFNCYCLYRGFVNKRSFDPSEHAPSMAALVGGIAGSMSLGLSPIGALRPYFWLPFLIDSGCVFTLVRLTLRLLAERRVYR
ncbi:MAG: hypothetical protein Q7T82_06825 [Armatimonadota bacterium]|nr:hypothetical protein [Armatimonadota bacterium]